MAIANSDGSIIITTKLDVTPVSKALNALKSKFASLKEQRSAIQALTTAIKDQQFVIKQLEMEYAMMIARGQGNTAQAEALKTRLTALKLELTQLRGAASAMGVKTAAAFTKASVGLKKFGARIAGIIKSAVIFSLLYKVMQSVVKLFKNILMSDEEFRQDWEELKAAFYAAAYPIINLIVPAVKWIVQQVRDWAVSIGKVAAALQGMSYSEMVDQAKASKEAADNYADMEKSSKKTADNVKKQLAGFDDIQTLSSGNEEEQGASGAGFEGLRQYDTSGEKSMLDDLMISIGGALAAVGLMLLCKGIITWGIGFLVAGAATWAITEFATGEFSTDPIVDTLIKIMGIAGTALLALGIILCVSGVVNPVSIGLIVAGAGLIATAVALNNEEIVEAIRGPIGAIMAIVGAALLVIGIILICTGVGIPIGIGLILAGVAATGTVVAVNQNAIVDWVKGAWDAVKQFWNRYIAPVFTIRFWLNLAKNCGNGLIGGFEAAINGIITMFERMINWIVDGLNKISFDVPDWVPLIGGKTFGFNIPRASFGRVSIPRLAQGAVIPPNREFLAVLGDNKKEHEIVSPLSTMKQAFLEALTTTNINGGQDNRPIILQIDSREIARATREGNASLGTQTVFGGFANAY
jgi:ribosomal protein L29